MSLYHEAATVLDIVSKDALSIKSVVFGQKDWKSPPKSLFALASEAARWSRIIAEIIDKSGLLAVEKQLSPVLSLVLVHDFLLSKKGIVLPSSHGLHAAVARHKARLNAELTKTRIRLGFANVDQLRQDVEQKNKAGEGSFRHPRWVRVNTISSTVEAQLASTFAGWTVVDALDPVLRCENQVIHIDKHVPNLLAIPANADMIATKAYKHGQIILQDKASCFPAYLLDCQLKDRQMIDACAAPGNKTTHLAAIAHSVLGQRPLPYIVACEKDVRRSITLETMVKTAGADQIVRVKQNQNFLKLEPQSKEFTDVTALLLDPSCSGSGIVGRDDSVTIHLPASVVRSTQQSQPRGKKRKHATTEVDAADTTEQEEQAIVVEDPEKLQSRLDALSEFQLRLLLHAMEFPAAQRITYSTCSVHATENENVVVSALASDLARQRGWTIMLRADQIDGMKSWHKRGSVDAVKSALTSQASNMIMKSVEDIASACIRCDKDDADGTMGFFVAGFVRDPAQPQRSAATTNEDEDSGGDDDWTGFTDGS